MNFVMLHIYLNNTKKRVMKIWKEGTYLLKTPLYEKKVKGKTDQDLKIYEDSLNQEKMNLNELIRKAEEKLRHENKKKVQTKLKLDQMVLRGVSAMNLEALKLAQNSLQGKYNIIWCRCI